MQSKVYYNKQNLVNDQKCLLCVVREIDSLWYACLELCSQYTYGMTHPFFAQAKPATKGVKSLVLPTLFLGVCLLELESPLIEHKILYKEVYWVVRFQV